MDRKQRYVLSRILSFMMILGFAAPAFSDSLEAGNDALRKGYYQTAIREFRKAAEQGDEIAQFNLGRFYEQGSIVPQNNAEAVKWYSLAAKNGHPDACFALATSYGEGRLGLLQNHTESAKWYQRAAESGNQLAIMPLGSLYENGKGVPKDLVQAYMWYDLGLNLLKLVTAKEPLERVANQMTSSQIEQARGLSVEWQKKYKKNYRFGFFF